MTILRYSATARVALVFHPLQIRIDDLLQAMSQRQADVGQAVVSTPALQPLLGLRGVCLTHGRLLSGFVQ